MPEKRKVSFRKGCCTRKVSRADEIHRQVVSDSLVQTKEGVSGMEKDTSETEEKTPPGYGWGV